MIQTVNNIDSLARSRPDPQECWLFCFFLFLSITKPKLLNTVGGGFFARTARKRNEKIRRFIDGLIDSGASEAGAVGGGRKRRCVLMEALVIEAAAGGQRRKEGYR